MKSIKRLRQSFTEAFNIEVALTGFSTDSRSIREAEVFFAIKGDHFDGHQFVKSALESSAISAVVDQSFDDSSLDENQKKKIIRVDNPVESLRAWAAAYRSKIEAKVIAIAGSNGKTTTKELLAHLMTAHYGEGKVFKTPKSENSILGTAMNVLRIREESYAIIEVGIDEVGWMTRHLELVQPDAGVITVIQEEHLSGLKDIETVASEELRLLDYLIENEGSFAANLDSPWIKERELPSSHLGYALKESADIEAHFFKPHFLHLFGKSVTCPLPGEHNAQNLLAAFSLFRLIEKSFDLSFLDDSTHRLSEFSNEKHRSQWIEADNSCWIFDDCYNANPSSMEAALEIFPEIARGRSMILVLGDMLELGTRSEEAHRRVVNLAAMGDYRKIYLLGPEFKKAVDSLSTKGSKFSAHTEIEGLKAEIDSEKEPDQSILLKGSRGMALERLIPIWKKETDTPL